MKKILLPLIITSAIIWIIWILAIGFYRIEIYNRSIDIKSNTVTRTIAIWHNADMIYRELYVSDISLEASGDSTMRQECERLIKEQKAKP